MNVGWLLRSNTIWWALGISAGLSTAILLFSPYGLPSLRKREAELQTLKKELALKARQNRELLDEVKRLKARDPELLEALARQRGFARPGETIYMYRETPTK